VPTVKQKVYTGWRLINFFYPKLSKQRDSLTHQYTSLGVTLMGGLINLIKNLFSGIFGFIGGLFGGKKGNNGFFLEMDDSQAVAAAEAAVKPAQAVAATASTAIVDAVPEPKTEKKSSRKEKLAELAKKSEKATPAEQPQETSAPATVATPAMAMAGGATMAAETGFASKYMGAASTSPRRRPGANMNSYLDMARNMK
jgi:hypothetical protein